jgi:hypothetical protein
LYRLSEKEELFRSSIFSKKDIPQNHPTSFCNKNIPNILTEAFKTIETVLLFTDIVDDKLKKKNKHYGFSEKSYKELRDKCQKVFMLLKQSDCEPEFLFEKDFEYYISGVLSMQFKMFPHLIISKVPTNICKSEIGLSKIFLMSM